MLELVTFVFSIRTDYQEDVEALKRTQYLQKVGSDFFLLWPPDGKVHNSYIISN